MLQSFTARAAALLLVICSTSWGEQSPAVETLNRYLDAPHACTADGKAMEVNIEASLPKLQKQGTMHGLKVVSQSGQVAYRFLRFTGDKLVKTDVIARFLNAEVHPPEGSRNIDVSAKNYKFHYLRADTFDGTPTYVYQLRPRKKREGLFKGELWLDARTATPIRESGELVKSPSIFIQKVSFVRDYSDSSACVPPHRTAITVQTRIAGAAEMVVWQNPVDVSWRPPDEEPSSTN